MNFKEFKEYYEKYGRCPGDAFVRKNPYTGKQLKTRYEKYYKKQMKNLETNDLRKSALKRDNNECQLYKKLFGNFKTEVDKQMFGDLKHLDMAHVFNKSSYPELKYDLDNVVMIYRIFHNRLDTQCNPITGKPITKEELDRWWEFIIGKDRWLKLQEKIK